MARPAITTLRKFHVGYQRIRRDPQQLERYETPDGSGPHILLIGPAEMPIPSPGWGAVETVISEQIPAFVSSGFRVTLLNSRDPRLWRKAPSDVDVVLCHYDALTARAQRIARRRQVPLLVASHYGFAAFPELWEPGYRRIFDSLRGADAAFCLSPAIADTFSLMGFGGKIFVTPNGSDLVALQGGHHSGPLVLGKVEPRKGQYHLAWAALQSGAPLTLVGPMHDPRVSTLLQNRTGSPVRWLGAWTRPTLEARLADFSCLILPSVGEADALVLYEAQLAGMPIVVSASGKGAQAEVLPWMRVMDDDVGSRASTYLEAASLVFDNERVRGFAENNYRWSQRIGPWVEAVRTFL